MRISILSVQEAWLVPAILYECLIFCNVVSKGIGARFVNLVEVNGGDVGCVYYAICSAHDGTSVEYVGPLISSPSTPPEP